MAINIPIISEFDSKGIEKAVKEFQSLEGAGAKAQFAIKKAAIPAAAALAGVTAALGMAVDAAMEDQQEQAILAQTLKNTTGATDAQTKAVEDQISKMSAASGIADTEYRKALEGLTRGTKDVKTAMDDMNLVMDISKATGTDAATVSDALAKAYQGNMKGLKALSPEMAAMIKDGASMTDILKTLGDTYGGTVAANAQTAAGKMEIFKNSISEAKENIGAALLPAIQAVMPVLIEFGNWAQKHTTTFLIIAGVIASVAVAVLAINTALKVYNAIQALTNGLTAVWNALLAVNPVVLIVVGIVALIAVMVLLYTKFEAVRNVVDSVFKFIKNAVSTGIDFITSYISAVLGVYKTIFNTIASLWNNTIGKLKFTLPSWIPGIGGSGFSMPQIPMLANGGIVTSPTLAMIGERGPEAVVPLNKMSNMGGGVNITINGGLGTSSDIAQAVYDNLRFYNQNVGPLRIRTA